LSQTFETFPSVVFGHLEHKAIFFFVPHAILFFGADSEEEKQQKKSRKAKKTHFPFQPWSVIFFPFHF
jgi:hypothetical protein